MLRKQKIQHKHKQQQQQNNKKQKLFKRFGTFFLYTQNILGQVTS